MWEVDGRIVKAQGSQDSQQKSHLRGMEETGRGRDSLLSNLF